MQGVRLMYNVLCLISLILFFLFWAVYQNMDHNILPDNYTLSMKGNSSKPSLNRFRLLKSNNTFVQELELLHELRLNDLNSYNKTVNNLKKQIDSLNNELSAERKICNNNNGPKSAYGGKTNPLDEYCAEFHKSLIDKIEILEEIVSNDRKERKVGKSIALKTLLDEYSMQQDECILNQTNLRNEIRNLKKKFYIKESECANMQRNLLNDIEKIKEQQNCQHEDNICPKTDSDLNEMNRKFLALEEKSRNESAIFEKAIEDLQIEYSNKQDECYQAQEKLNALQENLNRNLGECETNNIEEKVRCLLAARLHDQTECSAKLLESANKMNELEMNQLNQQKSCNHTIAILQNDIKTLTDTISQNNLK